MSKYFLNGWWYRKWSKFIHRFGYHYMVLLPVIDKPEVDRYRCHWCGLGGIKTSEYGRQKALEALSNKLKARSAKGTDAREENPNE